ncbi:beta-glucosidase [Pseudomonas duriflava]|uniref:beta-glucosidase n=1 Tax=Pseudomonas duriflava TaxID=459528 RepID=A0A562Q7B2_9PSED|nr:glycoside hydrolase family 3 N-terminal domain-containing protein [Pseudomonas duriflava]TWI52598.1 beta-glucosidase [Pseudomonas duriflava]
MPAFTFRLNTLGVQVLVGSLLLSVCSLSHSSSLHSKQPPIKTHAKPLIVINGFKFKDLNANNQLDAYENWRLPAERRAADLVSRMNLNEKAGMMLIDTLNPGFGGTIDAPADQYINSERMTRFIFRSVVTANPVESTTSSRNGQQVTPEQAARWTNAIQEMAEKTRLGIPVLFKSNARNHYERNARFGINTEAGSFSEFPKEAGLAATRDMRIIRDFARIMGEEWKAIGLRGMYGYMADLSTEPRWYRVHETFTEDADLGTEIMKTLVENLQGGPVNRNTPVALTMKHFPGGGPQEMGLDPHYTFGKNQVYPAGNFEYHLKPWRAAIEAGVSSVMPYYGVPIDLTYKGVKYEQTGMAFSKQIVNDLLRQQLGFKGYVNSDTGIISARGWGLENKTVAERAAAAINSGTDVLSGFNTKQTIIDLVKSGLVSEERVDEAVRRLLKEQFELGLFENPYVDASKAAGIIGNDEFRAKALQAQRKSIVLLQNLAQSSIKSAKKILPIPAPSTGQPLKLYTMNMNADVVGGAEYGGYTVVNGDYDAEKGQSRPSASGADYAILRIEVSNPQEITGTYKSKDSLTGANPAYINPQTQKTWGAADPDSIDDGLIYGGALPWEVNALSFTEMAKTASWSISPKLEDIQAVMQEVGSKKTILAIYFRQPYVMDDASGLKNAGAILAGFGVSDSVLMDVITGKYKPRGKLPFALANNLEAVINNDPDAPGYPAKDTLFPFGFGLSY